MGWDGTAAKALPCFTGHADEVGVMLIEADDLAAVERFFSIV